jgi:hypothetical protein
MDLCLVGLEETYGFDDASRWVTKMQSFLESDNTALPAIGSILQFRFPSFWS